jgi:DNA polymerase-3 subunit beta
MLNTLPVRDFPALEESDYPAQLTIKQSQLKNLLIKTYFAMSQQDVRHYLNGTFLEINSQSMKCVAADGHRLAMASTQDESIDNIDAKVVLPRKSVLELVRLLGGDADHDVCLHLGTARFRLVAPDFIFTTKLINVSYPDYKRLIPKGVSTAVLDREALKQALVRVSILSNEKFRGVRFQLELAKLRITANNSDQEQAEEVVPVEYEGGQIEMGFNVAYLLDVVSAITAKSIRCLFSGPNEGVLIEPIEGDHSLYVVMPMRF